jgi:hypothetical protein
MVEMDSRIVSHVREIKKCNQRGGRMLSIHDLLDAGTLDFKVARYLLAAISGSRSFLVGAMPGGAGKTTVMGALLNFLPDIEIIPTENSKVIANGLSISEPRCYLAHEIGRGRWYSYIWGRDVDNFLELTKTHVVAGNLHADDIEDVLSHDGIDDENIAKLDLLIFMRMGRGSTGTSRRISSVLENRGGTGSGAFKQVFVWNPSEDTFEANAIPRLAGDLELEWAGQTLREIIDRDLRTIEEVRSAVLSALPLRNT